VERCYVPWPHSSGGQVSLGDAVTLEIGYKKAVSPSLEKCIYYFFPSGDAAFFLVTNLVDADDLFMATDLLPSFSLDGGRSFFEDAYDYRSNGADTCYFDIISDFSQGEDKNEASTPTESASEGAPHVPCLHETVPGPMTDGSRTISRQASNSPPPLRSKRCRDTLSKAELLENDSDKRMCLRGPVSPNDHDGHDLAVAVIAMTNESASNNDLPGAYSDAGLSRETTGDAALGGSATEGPWLADSDALPPTESATGDGSSKEAALVISDAESESADSESADSESADSESADTESEQEWEVRTILDEKVVDGEPCLLVDWMPTWMRESELDGCRESINTFREKRLHQTEDRRFG
jgi:hypothetical protein